MEHIVIIGNGIAGVSVAKNVRKLSDCKITIISSETEYFFSRTALMYVFMGHMKFEHLKPYENDFWKKNNINLNFNEVIEVNTEQNLVAFIDKSSLKYDKLVIATGSKSNKFGWKNQDANGVLGLYHKQDLDKLNELAENCTNAVVIGGGLIGIELVEMLLSRKIKVTYLIREKSFWNSILPTLESELITKHIREHHVDLRLETTLDEILIDSNGNATGIKTNTGEIIDCTIIGLTVGVSPNIDFLKDSNIALSKGVLVNRFLQTSIPNVYAIGDCAEQEQPLQPRPPIEAVWYTGKMMGEALAQTLVGKPMQYNPGHWFNSAKFLDIEYQTYGWVFAVPLNNESQFYWQHTTKNNAIRISFDKNNYTFLGINTFGIRMRHEFFDRILNEKKSVHYVIKNLAAANFDPEFYTRFEQSIQKAFEIQYPQQI
ncbi:MAG: FAD-dependent oxidoreductase [Flavobacterium sp.]|nr:FAD-dependent oxidoreductase [Flavobacterium sp.]